MQLKILKGLKAKTDEDKSAYESLSAEMRAAWPEHLPLFVEALKRAAEPIATPSKDAEDEIIDAVMEAADKVRHALDCEKLGKHAVTLQCSCEQ